MMILYLLFATNGSKHIPLFLKRDGGAGEGKNFFSREKKFFPSPASQSLLQQTLHEVGVGERGAVDGAVVVAQL